MANARFWIYRNCPTKLTLRPGQVLTHSTFTAADEGWRSEGHVWEYDGEVVSKEHFTDGTDCDGRLQEYDSASCPVGRLKDGPQLFEQDLGVIAYPCWEYDESGQRDFSAEAMGY
jgi:hypothetical protein